jgi:hypothetical protein
MLNVKMPNWKPVVLVLIELLGWGAVALLIYFVGESGVASVRDPWATERVAAYVLLVVGPLLVFLPVSLALRLGPLWVVGTGAWALLGYVLLFAAAPGDRESTSFFTYVAFLALVFLALGSAFAVPLGALSGRVFPPSSPGWARGVRQGGLLALFVVTMMAMSPLGVLNWLNVFLVFTIVALTEFFFLARV